MKLRNLIPFVSRKEYNSVKRYNEILMSIVQKMQSENDKLRVKHQARDSRGRFVKLEKK